MGADTDKVHYCRWPGRCDRDAATLIGTTSLTLFHCCYRHAEEWRGLSWRGQVNVHRALTPPRFRRVQRTAGPYDYRDNIGIRENRDGGIVYG